MLVGTRLITGAVQPAVFGTVSLLLGLGALSRNIFCAPILNAAIRFYSETSRSGEVGHLRKLVSRILLRSTALLVAVTLMAGAAYALLQTRFASWQPVSFWTFVLLAGLLAAEVARAFESGLWSAARRQRPVGVFAGLESLAKPLLAVLAVGLIAPTPEAMLLGYVMGTGAVHLLSLWVVPREGAAAARAVVDPNPEISRGLWAFALPLIPLALVGWLVGVSDRYIIGGMLDVEQVGIYAAAYGLMSQPFLLVHGTIGQTLRTVYFSAVSDGNKPLERRTLLVWIVVSGSLSLVGFLAVLVLHRLVTTLFLDERYHRGAEMMPWIAGGYTILVFALVIEHVLLAYKRTSWVLIAQSAGAVASIVVTIPMVKWKGAMGAAMACPIYFSVQTVVTVTLAAAALRQSPKDLPRSASPFDGPAANDVTPPSGATPTASPADATLD